MFIPNQSAPSERKVERVKESSLFGTVAKTAMSFIGYGIGLKVFRSLGFRANVGLGKFVAKLSAPKSNLAKSLTSAIKSVRLGADTPSKMRSIGRFSKWMQKVKYSARRSIARINKTMEEAVTPLIKEGRYSNKTVARVIERSTDSLAGGYSMPLKAGRRFVNAKGKIKDIRLIYLS